MKRSVIMLLITTLLCGCPGSSFTIEELKPEDQNPGALPVTAPSGDGFYSVAIDSYDLSCAENYDHMEFLTSMVFSMISR